MSIRPCLSRRGLLPPRRLPLLVRPAQAPGPSVSPARSPRRRAISDPAADDTYFIGPRPGGGRAGVPLADPAKRGDPADVTGDWGRRAGLRTRRAATCMWSDIPNNRQLRGERTMAGQPVPPSIQQLERQQLRLPGPPALLRASDPARGALRAGRFGHGVADAFDGKRLETLRRRGAASRRKRRFTDPPYGGSCTKAARHAADAQRRGNQPAGSASAGDRRWKREICRPTPTASPRTADRAGGERGEVTDAEKGRALARLQEVYVS